MKEELLERFLRYVKIDTQSKMDAKESPTTEKQFDLARLLKKELEELGLEDIELDNKCYLMATLPPNISEDELMAKKVPTIGFLAHMDTSPEVSGTGVKPHIIENYDGKDIVLAGDPNQVIRVKDNPDLKSYVGKEIITSDGTTLLGADDKAGVAEIMTALSYLKSHPEIRHGKIRVAFTPDEEVGKGTEHF
ncbi:MAG TPA: tripeptide aminopeptidase PepT, partial [Thermoplasmata archaeon]|nr:tripeptide aminopeptidase PepT [Thermoplasmata archaeon]